LHWPPTTIWPNGHRISFAGGRLPVEAGIDLTGGGIIDGAELAGGGGTRLALGGASVGRAGNIDAGAAIGGQAGKLAASSTITPVNS